MLCWQGLQQEHALLAYSQPRQHGRHLCWIVKTRSPSLLMQALRSLYKQAMQMRSLE